MPDNKDSYKQIFKATSIYGGVQVVNIVISVIRSKFIAILLGPGGMGIVALFTTTISLIAGITNFGLGTAAVKNVAAADSSGDVEKLQTTVAVFKHLVWITGFAGFLVTLIFAPILSDLAFGNKSYTVSFLVLAITLLLAQISAGQNVILQGMRKIQYLAKSSMFGSIIGLFISIPLYYFFKENGIVPAIVVTAISTLLLSWYFASKIKIKKIEINRSVFKEESKDMLKMGFLINAGMLLSTASLYILRIYINNRGDIKDVGLFTAGFAIINGYFGMIFTAMGTDYYPRLASVATSQEESKSVINQQAEMTILLLAPILAIFIVFIPFGVQLLYSREFLGIVEMLQWSALGILFQAISWSIAFLFLAKGKSKVFFWNEFTAHLYIFLMNMLGYYYMGLTGLGISFAAGYFFYAIQVYFSCKKLYQFKFSKELVKIFVLQFLIVLACFIVVRFLNNIMAYSLGILLILSSCVYSWIELDKRIKIKDFLNTKLKR